MVVGEDDACGVAFQCHLEEQTRVEGCARTRPSFEDVAPDLAAPLVEEDGSEALFVPVSDHVLQRLSCCIEVFDRLDHTLVGHDSGQHVPEYLLAWLHFEFP